MKGAKRKMVYFSVLQVFTLITFIVALAYFYMFSKHQEGFIKFWGLSWVAYSFSLFCLVLFIQTDSNYLLEIRKIADMLNILFLLLGTLAFIHIQIATYWYRFSLYMVLLASICAVYRVALLSFYLPISLFQIGITLSICYYIFKYWTISPMEKVISLVVFFIWGMGKSFFSLAELYYVPVFNLYFSEIILSSLLNFCILTLYIQYTRKALDLTEHLYKTVVENASDAIFYYKLKPYQSFEYVSPSVVQLTGYNPSQFYENPRMYITLVKPVYIDEIQDVFNGHIEQSGGNIFELVKKNGDIFWGEINSSIIYDNFQSPIAVEGILRDITEMKSAQLEQINAKQSRDLLLSYISHELRTPVTSMAGYLTALSDGILTKDEDRKEAMKIITSKTLLLKKLIDDLDQLSKLETNQFSFDFMTFTAFELTDSLLREHLIDLRNHHAEIKWEKAETKQAWIVADQERINQVFTNILSNAMKYSGNDSHLQISFLINKDDQTYSVSITNWGKSIDEKELPHVFDRFYRVTDNKNMASGRGLGLTISKEIINAHNGDITAQSIENHTTFTFTIPLFKEAHDDSKKNSNY
ncbi:MAG: ATP-binding protein [Anaerovoracaceae bacterium]